mmetsp:Transcript_8440/g.21664  ORF Transcript_8440/g.21664 Transcript_8440/m.21664 type:complete len:254 (-) Transcript_8440:404-1165(-)
MCPPLLRASRKTRHAMVFGRRHATLREGPQVTVCRWKPPLSLNHRLSTASPLRYATFPASMRLQREPRELPKGGREKKGPRSHKRLRPTAQRQGWRIFWRRKRRRRCRRMSFRWRALQQSISPSTIGILRGGRNLVLRGMTRMSQPYGKHRSRWTCWALRNRPEMLVLRTSSGCSVRRRQGHQQRATLLKGRPRQHRLARPPVWITRLRIVPVRTSGRCSQRSSTRSRGQPLGIVGLERTSPIQSPRCRRTRH